MTPTLLYLRGMPGSGKLTVGRLLEHDLGWALFWLHDLNPVFKLMGGPSARMIDDVVEPILQHFLATQRNLIYVRPSRERRTVERVRNMSCAHGYRVTVICLTAGHETLCQRVAARDPVDYRIHDRRGLTAYCAERDAAEIDGEHVVSTEGLLPEEVVWRVKDLLLKGVK